MLRVASHLPVVTSRSHSHTEALTQRRRCTALVERMSLNYRQMLDSLPKVLDANPIRRWILGPERL